MRKTRSIHCSWLIIGAVLAIAIMWPGSSAAQKVKYNGAELDASAIPQAPASVGIVGMGRPSGPPAPPLNLPSPSWGTANWITTMIGPSDFARRDGCSCNGVPDTSNMVGVLPALGEEYVCLGAPVRLPSGASLQAVRVFMNNTHPTNPSMGLWKYHQYYSSPEMLVGLSGGTPGAGNQFVDYVLPAAETVANENVYYILAMLYRDTVKTDQFHQIYGVQLWYQLQVSPAPSVASFNDVPTTHPWFQWIEALKQSGLTAGCGGGNFCPDSPVTRGQMAIFLSKALGLNWPN